MDERRKNGVYYTPDPLVRYIVDRTLGPLIDRRSRSDGSAPRVLDPACGEGIFLCEVFRFLLERSREDSVFLSSTLSGTNRIRSEALLEQVFGVDIDASALRIARQHLVRLGIDASGREGTAIRTECERVAADRLRHGDALQDGNGPIGRADAGNARHPPFAWRREFPAVFLPPEAGFDAIVGNPPYVNIRRLTHSQGDEVKQFFRGRYRCARGAYDLYVLFVERAFQLLRPGGRCGFVLPNKIAAADYARACRSLLLEQATIEQIVDVSEMNAFPEAGVYPYVVIWKKASPPEQHRVSFYRARVKEHLIRPERTLHVPQAALSAQIGFPLEEPLDVESRAPTSPLSERAHLHSGTTGFAAENIADCLIERNDHQGEDYFEFIVSGNIDRYRIRRGAVRFMKRNFRRPVLSADCDLLTINKRDLYRGPKIVVAGMTKRLEAAWDKGGLALGVQVFAAQPQRDPWLLLGVLNSKLISFLYRLRFPAKHLAGGFLAMNKRPLGQLPIRTIDAKCARDREWEHLIAQRARRMTELRSGHPRSKEETSPRMLERDIQRLEREIDATVYQLYGLTPAEVERVESAFPCVKNGDSEEKDVSGCR